MVSTVPILDFLRVPRRRQIMLPPLAPPVPRGGRGAVRCPGITYIGGTHRFREYGIIAYGGCPGDKGGAPGSVVIDIK